MLFKEIFGNKKPIIACIHLLALPGAPLYKGSMKEVYDRALEETSIFLKNGVDGLIIENFRDKPFFPGRVPAETIAAIAAIGREIVKAANVPIGINVLRNDAESAMAIASVVEADFMRVNVHGGVIISEQGIIQGTGHLTVRLRSFLQSNVAIFADVGVKHAAPLVDRGLAMEAKDLTNRCMVDALIVSGELTGAETNVEDIDIVRKNSDLPILIGSGATAENVHKVYPKVDGLIVGSYFKKDGKGDNLVEASRVKKFKEAVPV
jgi:membrane complex biogenesis BtpA family protein